MAVTRDPKDVDLRHELGGLLLKLGEDEKVLNNYREVVEMFPNVPEYHVQLGDSLMRTGNQAAAEEFERAIYLDPFSQETYENIAEANQRASRFKAAAANYEKVLQLEPQNESVAFKLGSLYYELATPNGRDRVYFRLAEERLRMVTESQEGATKDQLRSIAYLRLGDLYLKWNRPGQATEAYEHALDIRPTLRPARNKLEQLAEIQ